MVKTFAILATGESMSQSVADAVRPLPTIVVNDCFRLRPDATALVAQDKAWWRHYPEALQFAGRKFSTNQLNGVEQVPPDGMLCTGSGSGMLAVQVAIMLGAQRILLLGYDLRGSHYFGKHPAPLQNTSASRFEVFITQFRRMAAHVRNLGVNVINCTPGSALDCFPHQSLRQAMTAC